MNKMCIFATSKKGSGQFRTRPPPTATARALNQHNLSTLNIKHSTAAFGRANNTTQTQDKNGKSNQVNPTHQVQHDSSCQPPEARGGQEGLR